MTALKLDTRLPLVVIVADFNPAIFTPLWVARHLHDAPEGAEVQVVEMIAEVPGGLAKLSFINGVALVVSNARLDAFVLGEEQVRIDALAHVLTNLVRVLPHTPLRGIGCNFQFINEESSDELLALFNSPESLEGEYVARLRQYTAQLEAGDAILNLTRSAASGTVQFSFNYHRDMTDPNAYAALVPDLVRESRGHALDLLRSIYGFNEYEPISFMPIGAEENENGQNAGERAVLEEHHDQG